MSPSEFERFSLSTRWVVEPRCLVEAPLQTRSKNPSSPVHRDQPDRATDHRNFRTDSEGYENSATQVMEHALLNDESVLQEIQKSLEGDQTTFLENNMRTKPKAGNMLSNGD